MISRNKITAIGFSLLFFALFSCNTMPVPIQLGKDSCSFCKMGFADEHFGAEIISKEGKVFKFDDVHCLLAFKKANTINNNDAKETFLVNFEELHNFIPMSKIFLLKSAELHSPMGGNVAAFSNENKLKEAMQKFKGEEISWKELINPK